MREQQGWELQISPTPTYHLQVRDGQQTKQREAIWRMCMRVVFFQLHFNCTETRELWSGHWARWCRKMTLACDPLFRLGLEGKTIIDKRALSANWRWRWWSSGNWIVITPSPKSASKTGTGPAVGGEDLWERKSAIVEKINLRTVR